MTRGLFIESYLKGVSRPIEVEVVELDELTLSEDRVYFGGRGGSLSVGDPSLPSVPMSRDEGSLGDEGGVGKTGVLMGRLVEGPRIPLR